MVDIIFLCLDPSRSRRQLEAEGLYDAARRIGPVTDRPDYRAIPVTPAAAGKYDTVLGVCLPASAAEQASQASPLRQLAVVLQKLRPEASAETITAALPRGYEQHGDLYVLPEDFLRDGGWPQTTEVWLAVAQALGCRRLARRGRVQPDGQRHSGTELLFGTDGWVERRENGIVYTWDVTRLMFSRGNISEKQRVARLPCSDEVVCDLYAGIGYFTLPYLVHAGARHVYACEWNPEAVAALRRNLAANKVRSRST